MWDEITVSLANESIESLEIESPRTREMDLGTNFPAVHPAFQLNIGNVKLRAFNVWKKKKKKAFVHKFYFEVEIVFMLYEYLLKYGFISSIFLFRMNL